MVDCDTCMFPTHLEGKCPTKDLDWCDYGQTGHFSGSKLCKKKNVLEATHQGHPGRESMLRQLRQSSWWPGMTEDIKELIEGCIPGQAIVGAVMSPPIKVTETPDCFFQHCRGDFKGPIGGDFHLHFLIHNLSRYPGGQIYKVCKSEAEVGRIVSNVWNHWLYYS